MGTVVLVEERIPREGGVSEDCVLHVASTPQKARAWIRENPDMLDESPLAVWALLKEPVDGHLLLHPDFEFIGFYNRAGNKIRSRRLSP